MNRDQLTAMTEAAELTRAGRFAEATALIQRSLNGGGAGTTVVPGTIVIDEERPPPPEPRGGGLKDLLRERLSRVADGVRTHLPPSGLTHLPGLDNLGGLGGPPAAMPTLPGRTLQAVHRGAAGARPYTLYVPTTGTGPRPLVVMLHGGTQTAADFATATRMSELAEEHGVLVAYPEQVTSANAMRYWNWFEPGDQRRGAGEPAVLAGIVDEIAREHEVDRERVFVAGFSAGAAMAAVLGAAYPDVFAAVDRPVPVIAFHGDADSTVGVDNATRVVEQFTGGAVRGDTLVERGPGRPATRVVVRRDGDVTGELWTVHGSGHAWSGGVAGGSYTDPGGPDASAEMLRFFAEHPRRP